MNLQYIQQHYKLIQKTIPVGGILSIHKEQSMNTLQKLNHSDSNFIPFLKERDSMNRLIKGISPQGKNERKSSISNTLWKHNSQNRIKSPLKRIPVQLNKQRSYSNMEPKIQQIQVQTDRGIEEKKITLTSRSPIKVKRQISQKNGLFHEQINEKTQNQIKLPAFILKQYVQQMITDDQKIKDVLQPQDRQYEFPVEFEKKIIQMKKDVRILKHKLKHWDLERRTNDDVQHLKQVANSILNK